MNEGNIQEPLARSLLDLSEHDLLRLIVVPLFLAMGYERVELSGGPYEAGRDLICWRHNGVGELEVSVAQVKKTKFTLKLSSPESLQHILVQLENALEIPVRDLKGREYTPAVAYFITPYPVRSAVIDALEKRLQRLSARVRVIDGPKLSSLLFQYVPHLAASASRGPDTLEATRGPERAEGGPADVDTRARRALDWLTGMYYDLGSLLGPDTSIDPSLCFVIMSFSKNGRLQDFYEKAIKPTVESLGYRCQRVDEQHFNGRITEQIFRNIREARLVLADLTEARQNCYYELGVAHALKKDVIHLASSVEDIHFDVKDYNFILYSRIDELAETLRDRILSTIGEVERTRSAQPDASSGQPASPSAR